MGRYTTMIRSAFAALCLMGSLATEAATEHSFAWEGQLAGVSAKGSFSYEDADIPDDGIIRKAQLQHFDVSFYAPDNTLMRRYRNNHLTYAGFNFNYDTTTGQILQDGAYASATGLDIGEWTQLDGGGTAGLNLWSAPNHLHFDDWDNAFGLPPAFGPHEDIAWFIYTTQYLLDEGAVGTAYQANPNAPLDATGARVAITPLPASSLMLAGGFGLMAFARRRRS